MLSLTYYYYHYYYFWGIGGKGIDLFFGPGHVNWLVQHQ